MGRLEIFWTIQKKKNEAEKLPFIKHKQRLGWLTETYILFGLTELFETFFNPTMSQIISFSLRRLSSFPWLFSTKLNNAHAAFAVWEKKNKDKKENSIPTQVEMSIKHPKRASWNTYLANVQASHGEFDPIVAFHATWSDNAPETSQPV